jgi:hypothetical protein
VKLGAQVSPLIGIQLPCATIILHINVLESRLAPPSRADLDSEPHSDTRNNNQKNDTNEVCQNLQKVHLSILKRLASIRLTFLIRKREPPNAQINPARAFSLQHNGKEQ